MQEIEKYFERLSRKDFRCDLEPMRQVAEKMGNPQHRFNTVHIVGTNGKGSTAAFLSSLLKEAGFKVGLMTSPHLVDVRERIQINGENISEADLKRLIAKVESHFSSLAEKDYLSFFEMITMIGFLYFEEQKVDWAIIEAGMGGRLDATNLLNPKFGIFTPIALDHQEYLGSTLKEITREKCGILKSGMTVISAPQDPDVADVISEMCYQNKLSLNYAIPEGIEIPLGLKGEHQKMNAACALVTAHKILGAERLKKVTLKGLAEATWPGRLQYLRHNPTVLLDGAHNRAGIEALAFYLREKHPNVQTDFLVGVLKDKDWKGMFKPLVPFARRFLCVTPASPRALPAAELAAHLETFGKPAIPFEKSAPILLKEHLAQLAPEALMVATGSLYMIGELLHVSSNATQKT